MGILDSVLKVFVGDKSKKDIGEIQPLVDAIKKHESAMSALSIDELRAKSDAFRQRIADDQKELKAEVDKLVAEAETLEDIDELRRAGGEPVVADVVVLVDPVLNRALRAVLSST